MTRYTHRCTECNDGPFAPGSLTVKKIVFKQMGANGRNLRSRNVAWLCKACLLKDTTFQTQELAILDKVETSRRVDNERQV